MWKIKKIISKGDYLYALVPDHPSATKNGYVLLHRVLMENHLGRVLNSNEIVHHKDHNKKNNSIRNLEILDCSTHSRLHCLDVLFVGEYLRGKNAILIWLNPLNIIVLVVVLSVEVDYMHNYNIMA